MASVQISKDEMLKRVAHFKELKPMDYKALGMSDIPEGIEAFSIIGQVLKRMAVGMDVPIVPGIAKSYSRGSIGLCKSRFEFLADGIKRDLLSKGEIQVL